MAVSTTAATADRPSLWRNRDFLALWGGQIISTLGSRTSATALPLLVLATTGSPSAAGLVAAAGSLPYLVMHLPAGTLVDRWDRRRTMLTSELVAGLALASIPAALWTGWLTVPQLMVVAFAQGTCFAFFGLAEQAALPRIVPGSALPAALAQNEAKGRGAALVGPPLGGLLFSAGRALPFLADAVSCLAAAVGILFVRKDLRPERTVRQESLWRETTAGLRWLWRHPLIRAAVLLVAASNLVFQALSLVLVVLARHSGASAGTIGLMFGIYGGGGLLGALAAGRLQRRFSTRAVIVGVNWIWAALLPLLALTSNPLLLGVIGGTSAFLGPLWNVVFGTYQLALVPDELMGRVGSAAMTLCWGVLPLGSITAGYLLTGVGPVGTVLLLTAVMVATAVAATVSPAVRHAPPLPSDREPH